MTTILVQPKKLNFISYNKVVSSNELGYEIVELSKPEILNDTFSYLKVENFYKDILSGFNGKVTFHGAFIDLRVNSPDRLIRMASEKRIRSSFESAIKLNSSRIIFHSGYNPVIKNVYYRNNFVNKSINFWAKMIEEYDIEVSLENMWDQTPNVLESIVSSVSNNKLSVCFDIGHFNVFSKVSLGNWIKTLSPYINQIHFSDNLGDSDSHLEIGVGKIDWKNASKYFEIFTRETDITIEVPEVTGLIKSISYLKKNEIYPFNKSKFVITEKVF